MFVFAHACWACTRVHRWRKFVPVTRDLKSTHRVSAYSICTAKVCVPLRLVAYGPAPSDDRSGGVFSSIVRSTISGVLGRAGWVEELIFAFNFSRRSWVLSSRSLRRCSRRSALFGFCFGDPSTTISSTSSSSSESVMGSTSVPSSSVTSDTTVRNRLLRPGGWSSMSLRGDRRCFLNAPDGVLVLDCV